MRKIFIRISLALALMLLLAPSEGTAKDLKVFKRIKDIYVVVDLGGAKVPNLTKEIIKTDVKHRLRRAGIKVIGSQEEWLKPQVRPPMLAISISVIKDRLKKGQFIGYTYLRSLKMNEKVRPIRNPSIKVWADTWSDNGIATISRDNPDRKILNACRKSVDKFIKDYLAANPKK